MISAPTNRAFTAVNNLPYRLFPSKAVGRLPENRSLNRVQESRNRSNSSDARSALPVRKYPIATLLWALTLSTAALKSARSSARVTLHDKRSARHATRATQNG